MLNLTGFSTFFSFFQQTWDQQFFFNFFFSENGLCVFFFSSFGDHGGRRPPRHAASPHGRLRQPPPATFFLIIVDAYSWLQVDDEERIHEWMGNKNRSDVTNTFSIFFMNCWSSGFHEMLNQHFSDRHFSWNVESTFLVS
jgi:hypothetical protein